MNSFIKYSHNSVLFSAFQMRKNDSERLTDFTKIIQQIIWIGTQFNTKSMPLTQYP